MGARWWLHPHAVKSEDDPLPFVFSVHKQQAYPAPLPERRDGGDEAQRGTKRAAAGPRRGNKEHPLQPFIMKYVIQPELL